MRMKATCALLNEAEVKVASASILKDRRSARLASVEQHIQLENAHDLEGVMSTFGDTARYDDEPWGETLSQAGTKCVCFTSNS